MNKKGFVKDLIIVVLGVVVLVGGYFVFLKKTANVPGEINYRNDKYGFGLTLASEYNGYNVSETDQIEYYGLGGKIIEFNVDSARTTWPSDRFSVFAINVYPIDWWNQNAKSAENNTFYKNGEEQNMGSYLGLFLGKNGNYAFTWGIGQDCPGIPDKNGVSTGPSWQCDLFGSAPNIIKTFKILK